MNKDNKGYSAAFKRKAIERLTGKDGVSASQLSDETGVSQNTLSRWLREARRLRVVKDDSRFPRKFTVDEKARIVVEASKLTGYDLTKFLEKERVSLADLELWRQALALDAPASAPRRYIRRLEREVARKDKALAEAAALLVLKKKMEEAWGSSGDEDDDEDEENDK